MPRSKIIVVILFVVAFGAGLTTGRVFQHHPKAVHERGPSWLSSELDLSEPQREEMLAIWGSLYKNGSSDRSQRRELQKWRNEAIAELIPENKQQELETISKDYSSQLDELMAEGRLRYDKAVEQTKAILTPEQRLKYEEVLTRREQQRRRGGPDRGGRDGERNASNQRPSHSPKHSEKQPAVTSDAPTPSANGAASDDKPDTDTETATDLDSE